MSIRIAYLYLLVTADPPSSKFERSIDWTELLIRIRFEKFLLWVHFLKIFNFDEICIIETSFIINHPCLGVLLLSITIQFDVIMTVVFIQLASFIDISKNE